MPCNNSAVCGLSTSATVRPAFFPVAAYTSAKSDINPLLLYCGCVCPNLNCPHWGYPYACHPFGLLASERMSAHPIGFLPQPNASAIGFHMAMTTGDSTRFSVELTKSLPVLLCDLAFPSLMNAPEAGLTMCAWVVPSKTASMHSPEPMGM